MIPSLTTLLSISGIFLIFILLVYLLSSKLPSKIIPNHVVIIGGSSGLGLEIAKLVSKRFPLAQITLIARNVQKLNEAKNSLSNPENCKILSFDICGDKNDPDNHKNIVKELTRKVHPSPDVLICSAGAAHSAMFEQIPTEKFQQQMDLHYFSCVLPTLAFLPEMKRQNEGRICFVSSVAGQLGVWGLSAYAASKFAIVGLAQALSSELKPFNIGVTISYPPDMDTPGFAEENKIKPWECVKISETGGLLQAKDVAKTTLNDILVGKFASSHGFDAWLSTLMSMGWSPGTSLFDNCCEILFGGLLRIVNMCYMKYFDYIARVGKEKRKRD